MATSAGMPFCVKKVAIPSAVVAPIESTKPYLVHPGADRVRQDWASVRQGYFDRFPEDGSQRLLSITGPVVSLGNFTRNLSTLLIARHCRLAHDDFPLGGVDVPDGPRTVLVVREDYWSNQATQMHQYAARSDHLVSTTRDR